MSSEVTTYKALTVKNLPPGYFKERLTTLVRDPSAATVPIVAITGHVNDFAVYIGWPDVNQLTPEAQQVVDYAYYAKTRCSFDGAKRYGDKISEREARALFPDLAALSYRG
jgi:hypothetical protein